MGLFDSIADTLDSVGGQIGAVAGGLAAGVPGAIAGAVIGNELDYWGNQLGDATGEVAGTFSSWIETAESTIEYWQGQLGDEVAYQIEYSGFDGGDITNWVDASTYYDYSYVFDGAVGKFDAVDAYSFTIDYNSNFYANLTGLESDVDIQLVNAYGGVISSSLNLGTSNESVSALLNPGTYYLDVVSYDRLTSGYSLEIGSTLAYTAAPVEFNF